VNPSGRARGKKRKKEKSAYLIMAGRMEGNRSSRVYLKKKMKVLLEEKICNCSVEY